MPDQVANPSTLEAEEVQIYPRGHDLYKIPKPEEERVKTLRKRIESRLESEEHKQFLKDIEINRKYAKGEQNRAEDEDEEAQVVRANLIHPELKKALNECYAKNPELSITPKESVDKSRYEVWKAVGKTLEIVLNHEFAPDNAALKKKAKRSVRSADTTGFGWLKVIFQKHIDKDPTVTKRIDDVQDNIEEIDRLLRALNDKEHTGSEEISQLDSQKEELNQLVKSLEEKHEVVRSMGINFAVRPSENVVFSDEIMDVEELPSADWITDLIWMRESKVKARFNFAPQAAIKFYEKTVDPKNFENQKEKSKDGNDDRLLLVYEMWNNADKRIYTMCAGYDGYLKDPFTPRKIGERFHGFFPLCFDETDGTPYPLSLVKQLRSMQDEHHTTRSNFREHREKSVPFNVAHGGELDKTDTQNLTNPAFMETVVLKSAPQGQPLDQVFKSVQNPPIDPNVYNTDHISRDWEQVTRRGDASRGTVGISKTAREADILQSNLNVDTSERRDVVEDWFQVIAKYCAELVLQEYSPEEVEKIAGPGATWPQLTKKDVFDMVSLDVRVGSSGKPNANQETERWLKMLPQFRESLLAITEMQEAGKTTQADILIKLLRETIERFEERIDLDALIPANGEQQQMSLKDMQEMRAKQEQIGLQMKDMISTIANRDADTMKKIAEAESKELGPQLQIYTTILQGLLSNSGQPQTPQPQTPGSLQ